MDLAPFDTADPQVRLAISATVKAILAAIQTPDPENSYLIVAATTGLFAERVDDDGNGIVITERLVIQAIRQIQWRLKATGTELPRSRRGSLPALSPEQATRFLYDVNGVENVVWPIRILTEVLAGINGLVTDAELTALRELTDELGQDELQSMVEAIRAAHAASYRFVGAPDGP